VKGHNAYMASAFELLRNTKGSHRGYHLVDKGLGESGGDSWGDRRNEQKPPAGEST